MKKFKIILPVLAFVMAITVAFAVPSETEEFAKSARYRDAQSNCVNCPTQVPDACVVNGDNPCTCLASDETVLGIAREVGGTCRILSIPD